MVSGCICNIYIHKVILKNIDRVCILTIVIYYNLFNFNCCLHTELYVLLYENIGQILPNKLHGSMHYKIGGTCVYNGHVF